MTHPMTLAVVLAAAALAAALSAGAARAEAPAPASPDARPPCFSGLYPHLAVSNFGKSEAGIGAVVPWAGRLWLLTYPAHDFRGGPDKLYELDEALRLRARPESVGGTHACRMIHTESDQLIIGPYFIDSRGGVRAVTPQAMPGRLTAVTRHLADPASKVYFFTMEEGLYEVDVRSLEVKRLHQDTNVGGKDLLPGKHGKGGYTAQGRLVVANNGTGGCLAEWDGSGDPGTPEAWKIVDKNKFCDVTGPGGLRGSPDAASPLWAIGWDHRSLLLRLLDGGRWSVFRLPKGSYTHDADHGWYTEWPRIREVTGGRFLLNMHGQFYDFPRGFREGATGGLRPLATFHRMFVDFTDWGGRLVAGCDDASRFGNPLAAHPQSNLWFGSLEALRSFGRPAGWGGPWVRDAVRAGQPSDPYLLGGAGAFEHRSVHFVHTAGRGVAFSLEIDSKGDGTWTPYTSVTVPAEGYAFHVLPRDLAGEWIRVRADADLASATAYFHYTASGQAAEPEGFRALAPAEGAAPRVEGVLCPAEDGALTLHFAATSVDAAGAAGETGHYVIGADMRLRRTPDPLPPDLATKFATKPAFEVDAASLILKEGKKVFRLPKGPDALCRASAAGWRRAVREVVTERSLLNVGGTFYELPRDHSGGLAKIRPIATHNRHIFDFASWRGLLVLSGTLAGAAADGPSVVSDDGKAALWFGNVDDLWRLGEPRGEGGPWLDSPVKAGAPSDPYLMTGYARKEVRLSHDRPEAVRFTLEVDVLGEGFFHACAAVAVPPGRTLTHKFPDGFSAHWVRVRTDADCRATALFRYNLPAEAK